LLARFCALSEAFRCCRSGPDALLRNLDSRRMQLSCACRESAAPSSPGTTLNFRAPTDLITSGARSVPHQLPLSFPETETVRECLPPPEVRLHVRCLVSATLITFDPQFLRPITDHRALFFPRLFPFSLLTSGAAMGMCLPHGYVGCSLGYLASPPVSTYGSSSLPVYLCTCTVIHLGQSIRFRMWWLIPTAVLAGTAEVIGWSGR
jgi:hypothetical protein